jgi:hypothetical protein
LAEASSRISGGVDVAQGSRRRRHVGSGASRDARACGGALGIERRGRGSRRARGEGRRGRRWAVEGSVAELALGGGCGGVGHGGRETRASDCPGDIWQPATAGSRGAGRVAEGRGAVVIDKRADCNQVTMPPQRRAEGDLAICGCYEVEWTLRAPRTGGGAVRPGCWSAKMRVTYAQRNPRIMSGCGAHDGHGRR